ncbi:MAG: isoprenylcysteine carboxylmethyltransferase family protein [Anaerolineae bacterium]|nr:isoprenylcysteine carboxylmethyltransferase family protein [Anaerolineae bacterium]
MDPYLMGYILLVLVYRLAESWAMARTGTLDRKPVADWTAALIMVPYWLVILGSAFEYITFQQPSTPLAALLGALFFAEAALVRVRAHLDLGEGFSIFLVEEGGQEIVTRGLYAHIRHPLYLANILLLIACPLFLSAQLAWIVTLLGIGGVAARINIKERVLLKEIPGYDEYKKRTARLIPKVW